MNRCLCRNMRFINQNSRQNVAVNFENHSFRSQSGNFSPNYLFLNLEDATEE